MKILVTGALGFIGSNIVARLIKENHKVIATDIKKPLENSKLSEFFECNISNLDQVKSLFDKYPKGYFDAVIHQGAFVSVPNSITNPLENHTTNVDGFFNILECCRIFKVFKIIYASSAAVYNYTDSPYGTSKYINEIYAEMYNTVYGIQAIGLRYFNVYGRNQSPEGGNVIPAFLKCTENGLQFPVFNQGIQKRDFIYIDDVVEANICALNKTINCFGVFDVASGTLTSVNDLVRIFKDTFGVTNTIEYCDGREGEKDPPLPDVEKAKNILGFISLVRLEEGLKKMV